MFLFRLYLVIITILIKIYNDLQHSLHFVFLRLQLFHGCKTRLFISHITMCSWLLWSKLHKIKVVTIQRCFNKCWNV